MATSEQSGDEVVCPTCGESFASKSGMKSHHTMVHGESIAGEAITCQQCGEEATFPPSTATDRVYCSEECMAEAYKSRVELTCEVCGQEYEVQASQKSNRRFCSRECALEVVPAEWQGSSEERRERVTVTCAACGSEFETHPYRVEKTQNQFCDADCYAEWVSESMSGKNSPHWSGGRPEVTCANCGSETTQHYGAHKRCERGFCDRECYLEWHAENMVGSASPRWKGGEAPYGAGWTRQKRRQVRRRDQYRCQDCGVTQPEHLDEHNEALHVHHIVPAREFDNPEGRNDRSNLITLCRACHNKWEKFPGLRPQ